MKTHPVLIKNFINLLKANIVSCFVSKELCLQTKLLVPSSCQVAEFLSKAPQPPPAHAIKNALQMLKVKCIKDFSYIHFLI